MTVPVVHSILKLISGMKPNKLPTAAEIDRAYAEGKKAVAELVNSQTAVIRALEARLKALEGETKKTSGNSSKSPSSDGLKKITKHTLRESSGKTSGGQVGHSDQTLRAVEKPNSIIVHSVSHCSHCQHDLARVKASSVEKRQVFEAPEK